MADLLGRESEITFEAASRGILADSGNTVMETATGSEQVDALGSINDGVGRLAEKMDGTSLSSMIEEAQNWSQRIVDVRDQINNLRRESATQKKRKTEEGLLEQIAHATSTLLNEATSKNTIWVGVSKIDNRAKGDLTDVISTALRNCGLCKGDEATLIKPPPATEMPEISVDAVADVAGVVGSLKPSGGGGGAGGPTPSMGGMMPGMILAGIGSALDRLSSTIASLANALDVHFGEVFAGLIKDENIFRQNMRQIINEVEGYGQLNREIEQSYFDIDDAARVTGVNRTKFQEIWLKNMKRGMSIETKYQKKTAKDDKRAGKEERMRFKRHLAVTKTALFAATQLGMSADAMSDVFMQWHLGLGLTALQIGQIGRNMERVARTSGVTGENMEDAIKASQQFAKDMRNFGNLTPDALEATQEMVTLFQKYDVMDGFGRDLLKTISTTKGFLEASPEMHALMGRIITAGTAADAVRLNEGVRWGQITKDPELAKTFTQNFGTALKNIVGRYEDGAANAIARGMGAADVTELDVSQLQEFLSKYEKVNSVNAGRMRVAIERGFGAGIGELAQTHKALSEIGMTNSEKLIRDMAELQKLEKRGLKGTDQYNELAQQIRDTEQAGLQNVFGRMADARKHGGPGLTQQEIDDALKEELGAKGLKDFGGGNMGAAADKMLKVASEQAKAAGLSLSDMLEKRGTSEALLRKGLVAGDEAATVNLQDVMQEAATQMKKNEDPITSLNHEIIKLNEWLRGKTSWLMRQMTTGMVLVVAGIGILAAVLARVVIPLLLLAQILPSVISAIGSMMSGFISMISGLAPIIGGILAPLQLAIGGLKGAMEAETVGRTKTEGAILGALTGGADTGSMFSKFLGIEKGSTGDKAMGVAGAAAWGAAAGALLAPITGGLSIPIGAAIGAAVELIKILTAGTDILATILTPISSAATAIGDMFGGIWDMIAGVFTLDAKRFVDGLSTAFMALPNMFFRNMKWAIIQMPKMFIGLIGSAFKAVFVDLPKWLMNTMDSAFASLMEIKWLAPMIKPIQDVWVEMKNIMMSIWQPINDLFGVLATAWDDLWVALQPITDIFKSIKESIFGVGDGSGLLVTALTGVAKAIGFVLKVTLTPLRWFLKAFGFAVKLIMKIVKPVMEVVSGMVVLIVEGIQKIVGFFQWMHDVLIGHSIIPDLIKGIIKWFAMLPINILRALAGLAANAAEKLLGWIGGGLKAVFIDFPKWLWNTITDGLSNLGTWMMDTITAGLAGLKDWLIEQIPGAKTVVEAGKNFSEGFNETNAEASTRIADQGSSMASGYGRYLGGLKDTITGGQSGRWEGAKKAAGGAWEMTKAGMSAINPFNWFAEGTRMIDQAGLGILHEGEMVIPKDLMDTMIAIGSGPTRQGDISPQISMMNEGLFAGKENVRDASSEAMIGKVKGIVADLVPEPVRDGASKLYDMVVPDFLKSGFKAIGGTYASAYDNFVPDFMKQGAASVLDAVGSVTNMFGTGSLVEKITGTGRERAVKPSVGMINEGVFESGQAREAISEAINVSEGGIIGELQALSAITSSILQTLIDCCAKTKEMVKPSISMTNEGMFERGQAREAVSEGVFGLVTSLASAPEALLEFTRSIPSMISSYVENLGKSVVSLFGLEKTKETKIGVDTVNAGVFERGQAKDAMSEGVMTKTQGIMAPYHAMGVGFGDVNPQAILDNVHRIVREKKQERLDRLRQVQPMEEGLFAGGIISDAATEGIAGVVARHAGTDFDDIVSSIIDNQTGVPEASHGGGLDYRDSVRSPHVSTSMYSKDDAESFIERRRYTEGSGPTSMLPSMDSIASYLLGDQSQYFERMIAELEEIRRNTSGGASSEIVDTPAQSTQLRARSGVKKLAEESVRGFWGLQTGAFSQANVMNDGRR